MLTFLFPSLFINIGLPCGYTDDDFLFYSKALYFRMNSIFNKVKSELNRMFLFQAFILLFLIRLKFPTDKSIRTSIIRTSINACCTHVVLNHCSRHTLPTSLMAFFT